MVDSTYWRSNISIHSFSEEFRITLVKSRRIFKALNINGDEKDDGSAAIRFHLARNQQLTVAQLLVLSDAPGLVIELNRWADRARSQIDALGDVKATPAPLDVTAYIDDAARGDAEAITILLRWLQSVLPTWQVPHAWVAVRLLVALPANLRAHNITRIPLALLNVRKQSEFSGWWRLEQNGKAGRNQTFYARPKLGLDL